MAANRLPASWMNALDPAAGARRSRLTAARAGAPRCPYISRRSRPASGPTVTVPSSFGRGELPRRLRAPFARNVIPGAHATDRARGRSRCQRRSCADRDRRPAGGARPDCHAGHERTGSCPGCLLGRIPPEMRELGYVEGQNVTFEARFAEGRIERLPALAAEFVNMKVDVIVTGGNQAALAAKRATTSIPIVMATGGDQVGLGIVAGLARPGGNITGVTSFSAELMGKRLGLLKEVVPRLSRVAYLLVEGDLTSGAGLRH